MGIEDKFWLLEDDEDLSFERSRFYELRGGLILDGRAGEELGSYTVNERGADLLFKEQGGDRRILQFRMPFRSHMKTDGKIEEVDDAFDSEAPSYQVTFTSEKWLAYQATNAANDDEAALEAQEEWADEAQPLYRTLGLVYRDHPEVVQMGMNQDRENEVRMRREAMAAV